MLGIIGGSGAGGLAALEDSRRLVVRTPYGEPSSALTFGLLRGREVAFLARHGYGHTIPPHAVNYRANIWALKSQGVHAIVSVAAVGGIRADLAPGVLAVPSQIIDYTYGRRGTFFDGADGLVRHIDFTEPYTPALRGALLAVPGANIGHWSQSKFAVVPEVGANLGYQLTSHMKVFVGYNFIYLSEAVRAADQVDLVVDESQVPLLGRGGSLVADRPAPVLARSDFWVQGLMFGLEVRY